MPAAFPCGSGGTRHGFARALILSCALAQTNIVVLPAPKCKGEKTKIDEKLYWFLLSLTFSISASTSSSRVAQLVAKRTTERVSS